VRRALASLAACAAALAASAAGAQMRMDVGPNTDATYVKECGSCHFPYQPGWLPERSWRHIMGSLASHFGENASISAGAHQSVLGYLVAGAADRATNTRSREVMSAIRPGDTPTSITKVLYVNGIHGGFLDPAFKGKPQVKTLAHCSACHLRAERGWFYAVTYTISDESFRSNEVDTSLNLPIPFKPR
jgi:cytochrome c553